MIRFRTTAASAASLALGLTILASADTTMAHAEPDGHTTSHNAVGTSADSEAPASVSSHQSAPEITDHGIALESIRVSVTSSTDTLADGTNVAYAFNSGEPLSLNVLDMDTLEVVDRHELRQPFNNVGSHAINEEDNMFYFGMPNEGALYRYDPYAQEVTELATDVVGEQYMRSMLIMDGILYGSTYPNAKVFSYDLETGEIHDYGTVDEDSSYGWGFEEVDGNLWVGTGTTPSLRELDPDTGEITDIDLPRYITEEKDFIHEITRHDDLVLVRSSPSGERNLSIYDLEADEWCCDNLPLIGTNSLDTHDGKFYYILGTEVRGYDMETRENFSIGWNESNLAGEQIGSRPLQLVELDQEGYPGITLMAFRNDGALWYYNLENQAGEVVELPIEGAAATTQSLGIGPDGNAYVGPYFSNGMMGRINHDSGVIEQFEGPVQGDSVASVGDRLVIGTYSGAGFYAGDTTEDWDWGSNPDHLFTIGRDVGQDRVTDIVDADGLAAAGTIPNYGELGGALVIFDPTGGEPAIHRHLVADHSVTALAHHDGLIYGGTSIHGGNDSTPAEGPAELFIWDVQAGALVDSVVVDEAADIIHSLAFDEEGRLWGMADSGNMFEFDTNSHQVRTTIETGLAHANRWGENAEMMANPLDGVMYGNATSQMFAFDPESHEFTVFDGPEAVRHSTVHQDGTVYFTDRTNVYSFFPEAGATCDETITGSHNGQLVIDTGTVCIEDADIRGGIDVGAEASVVMTDSAVRGPVTATGAEQVQISGNDLRGPVRLEATTTAVQVDANEIRGPLAINDSPTQTAAVISDNLIRGPLQCTNNTHDPINDGTANIIHGRAGGQCAGL